MLKKYCFKNISFNKRELKDLVGQYYIKYGISKASCLLDSLKDLDLKLLDLIMDAK